jgi:hypothetical protein
MVEVSTRVALHCIGAAQSADPRHLHSRTKGRRTSPAAYNATTDIRWSAASTGVDTAAR